MTKMSSQNKHSLTYLKFLSLVEALRGMPSFPLLEPIEERILNACAAAWHKGQQITVLQAMQMIPDVSSATVHRRLKTLKSKGYLAVALDAVDSRIKYLVPTTQTTTFFTELGDALKKAALEK